MTDQVGNSKYTSPIPQLLGNSGQWLGPVNANNTVCNISTQIRHNKQQLEPGWQGPNIHSRRQLEFPIVPLSENRSIEEVLLETGVCCRRPDEVELPFITETSQRPHILDGLDAYPPNRQAHNERR